jgi:hypothetical protein
MTDGLGPTAYSQLAQRYISTRYSWFTAYDDLTTGNGFEDYCITNQSFFEQSYERLKSWETVKGLMDARSGQAKADAALYFKLLSLVKDCQSAKLVDFFNSIPYKDAFQGSSGGPEHYFPVYDDPKQTYESIITELGGLVDSLPIYAAAISPTTAAIFKTQDAVFQGDINKWVGFANSLRLKLLVRIAGVDEAFAKQHIPEVLAKGLPSTDLYWHVWYQVNVLSGGNWQRGLYECTYASFIPDILMKRMNYGAPAYDHYVDDPRLPVIAMPTKYKDYRGVTYNVDAQTPIYDGGEKYYPYADNIGSTLSTNAKSMYSHITYSQNTNMPVYMSTLGETDLLLAEVELKGLASTGKSAEQHMKDEVVHSTKFWYAINQMSNYSRGVLDSLLYPTMPSDAEMGAWGDTIANRFTAAASTDDKMEILMQQKFIHLNLLQPYECWAELRRTRHPKLEPMTYQGVVMKPMPERVKYPSSEAINNAANFKKVALDNNNTTPIFWVPDALKSVNPYWSDYNYK